MKIQASGSVVRLALLSLAVAALIAGCGRPMEQDARGERVLAKARTEATAVLDKSRVFFAHQSVGENIVEGLTALEKDKGVQGLKIVEQATAVADGAFFAHAKIGRNGDPKGKTDAFLAALEGGLGDRLDIAFQKYCFVDIDAQTNVEDLFGYYREAMARVRREFPRLRLVHVTTPLVHVQTGPRALVKRLMGRVPDHYEDNLARERFSALMRREYGGREPVFDLAMIEASRPGSRPEAIQFRGAQVFELLPEYTTDGAHLNGPAEERVATELLLFLGRVMAESGDQTRAAAR